MIEHLLKSSAVSVIKRPIRNLIWGVRGWRIVNPVLPRHVRSIVFVCLGNICRSPFAAAVCVRRLHGARAEFFCSSAGISVKQGNQPPDEARTAASAYGVSLDQHRPLLLTRQLVVDHDLVVVMDAAQLKTLRARHPDLSDRIVLLSLFDERASNALERFNIVDPFSRPLGEFVTCYERIDRAVEHLMHDLGIAVRPPRPSAPDTREPVPARTK